MVTKESINKFLSGKNIVIAGVSRDKKKFGNSAYRYLKSKGYNVFAVNPNLNDIDGDKCYRNLNEIPDKIESLLIVLAPEKTKGIIESASTLNVRNIWFQSGAESEESISFCQNNGINVIYNECILMFAEPAAFPHKVHRWINKIAGKIPK